MAYWLGSHPTSLKIWDSFIYFLFTLIGRILGLFYFVEDIEVKRWSDKMMLGLGIREEGVEDGSSFFEFMTPGLTVLLFSGFLIGVIGVVILILIYKNDYSPLDNDSISENITRDQLKVNSPLNFSLFTSWILPNRPKHKIRQAVYELERLARKNNKGRRPFETIEEWLRRLGFNEHLVLYQKVRYGMEDVSERETKSFILEIDKIKSRFTEEEHG